MWSVYQILEDRVTSDPSAGQINYCQKIGNLSTDVFEPRTSTGSCIFHSLEHFNTIAFETSNRRHKIKSFPVHGKEQNHAKKENIRLPVAVRGSKTSMLKFSITWLIPWSWGWRIRPGRRGYSSEFSVGVCCPVPQISTQFQTKIFHFPHPFSDLASKIHARFQTFVVLSFTSVTKSRIGKIQFK